MKITICEDPVARQYSIADARDHLSGLVHEVERGAPIELTRRGKAVAVLLSLPDYRWLVAARPTFSQALEAFRQAVDLESVGFDDADFAGLRD